MSRSAPFDNRLRLSALLEQQGVQHVHMGDTLGGKPSDRSLYRSDGTPDYENMGRKPAFGEVINDLAELAKQRIVALMCAEEDPTHCHRSLLLDPALEGRSITLAHIRKDGAVQPVLPA